MEDQVILLDTSILIDYFRKTVKEKTILHLLAKNNYQFNISVITHFEILRGINDKQERFWWNFLKDIQIISYFPSINYTALRIQRQLKLKRKSISIQDLLIASTAIHFEMPLASLNVKHFTDIDDLKIYEF